MEINSIPAGTFDDPLFTSVLTRPNLPIVTTDELDCKADITITLSELTWEVYPNMKVPYPHPVMYLTGEVNNIRPAHDGVEFPCGVHSLNYGQGVAVEDAEELENDTPSFSLSKPEVRYRYLLSPTEYSQMIQNGLGQRGFAWPKEALSKNYELPLKAKLTCIEPKEGGLPIIFAHIVDATCINTSAEEAEIEPLANEFAPAYEVEAIVEAQKQLDEAYKHRDEALRELHQAVRTFNPALPDAVYQLQSTERYLEDIEHDVRELEVKLEDAKQNAGKASFEDVETSNETYQQLSDKLAANLLFEDEPEPVEEVAEPEPEIVEVEPVDVPHKTEVEKAEAEALESINNFDPDSLDFFKLESEDEESVKTKHDAQHVLTVETLEEEQQAPDDLLF